MQDEFTAKMHEEFTLLDEAERHNAAFAVFQLVSDKITLIQALGYLDKSIDDVRPFVAEWNRLSTKQIHIE